MRYALPALPLALLPALLNAADHHHDHHTGHAPLSAHEHGVAELDIAVDDATLELELRTPAFNLLGFEHTATSEQEHRQVVTVQQQLEQAERLFGLPAAAGCTRSDWQLESPLFATGDTSRTDDSHSDVRVHYHYHCTSPAALKQLDAEGFFQAFPATRTLRLQVFGPNGQSGANLSPEQMRFTF